MQLLGKQCLYGSIHRAITVKQLLQSNTYNTTAVATRNSCGKDATDNATATKATAATSESNATTTEDWIIGIRSATAK